MKRIFRIENPEEFIGHGRPYAWGVIVDNMVTHLVYMGSYALINPDDELIAKRSKRKKYEGLNGKEIRERLNHGRFMFYRHNTKAMLAKIAEESEGELLSGIVKDGKFIVKDT